MPLLTLLIGQAAKPAFDVYAGSALVQFGVAQPVRTGDRLLIPLRATVAALGGTVEGPIRQRLYIHLGARRVELSLRGGKSRVDGIPRTIKAAPWISRGEAVVPPAFFTEALHLAVSVDRRLGNVRISRDGSF